MDLKFSFMYNIISSLICSAGLIYQLQQLFSQYLSGKTVVNVEVKKEINDNFPAFTVCFPLLFSLEGFANYFNDNKQQYEIYERMIQEIEQVRNDEIRENLYEKYKSNLTSIYQEIDDFHKLSKLRIHNIYDVIIDNLSIPYINNIRHAIKTSISVKAMGNLPGKLIFFTTQTAEYITSSNPFHPQPQPKILREAQPIEP